ncbi:MAG: AraC family transcriptional regulator [Alphaproteobacteria bacterium BRH_c36]|nr:MAG: AraC family transcriptional regulator [Alphaproteobacteria bacterium BRH_c36]
MADPLSEVLRSVRLKGGVFLDARFSAPWAVSSHVTSEDCRPILSKPAQMIAYHFLIEGRVLVSVQGAPAIEVVAGELVLLPRNDFHVLSSGPGLIPLDGHHLVQPSPGGGLAEINFGGGGEPVRMVCGFLGCEDFYNPLIGSLPHLLTIDIREATSRNLIEASMAFAARELIEGRLAASEVLSRLSELLLVEAIRRYATQQGEPHTGWLKALKDPRIGRAMALLHEDIATSWTAEALASAVGMSRSSFLQRFTTLIGVPPSRYLTAWRMETAKIQFRETSKSIAQVAHMIGYESEEAFSRAFKRHVGFSPASWREQQTS